MSDIVERLREGIDPLDIPDGERVMDKAADEIERLRLALAEEQARYPEAYIREAEAQIERLQAPPTAAEVEAAARAVWGLSLFPTGPHVTFKVVARAALEAAAKVREER